MNNTFFLRIKYADKRAFIKKFSDDEMVMIGSSPFNNLHLPISKDNGVHSIIEKRENGYIVTRLNIRGKLYLNDEEVITSRIESNDTLTVAGFKITFLLPHTSHKKEFKDVYRPIENINTSDYDKKIAKGFIVSLLLSFIFFLTISLWKVPDEIPVDNISERFSRLIIDPISNTNPMAKSLVPADDEGSGVRLAGEEGSRGEKTAKIKTDAVRQIVREKGVLGALSNKNIQSQLSRILNSGIGFENKFKKSVAVDNKGQKLALYKGSLGTGMKGTGSAGGGTSKDVIGGLSTKGEGGGLKGYGKGSVGNRVVSSIISDEVNTVIKGSLERSEIEAVIKRHLPQIRNCYEKELQTTPEISGKIVSFFIIGGNGYVTSSSVKETTMKNKAVEICVTRRIAKWIFPKPRGGGMVVVKYPFIFNNMDSN